MAAADEANFSKKKRKPGTGTIRQRKDGTWEARLHIPGRNPRSFYGPTEEEAVAKRTANTAKAIEEETIKAEKEKRRRARLDKPLLYFIQAGEGGPIKIGLTRDLRARLYRMKVECPYELLVLHTVKEASLEIEQNLHTQFSDFRVRGEWFYAHPTLVKYIQRLRRWVPPFSSSTTAKTTAGSTKH